MMTYIQTLLSTLLLLTISNIFMTFAWYGHLKYKHYPIYIVILASWGIAFLEYCFQIPANRLGHQHFPAVELKTLQEIITIIVFIVFSVLYLGEEIKWNHYVGLTLIGLGSIAVFYK